MTISYLVSLKTFKRNSCSQDAARLGTVHFALGRSNNIGGNTVSEVHWDALMGQATVELDGRSILEDGTLNI